MNILFSFQPNVVEELENGKKQIILTKETPHLLPPYKMYIYCEESRSRTYYHAEEPRYIGNGKVVGECIVSDILDDLEMTANHETFSKLNLNYYKYRQMQKGGGCKGLEIMSLRFYQKPKELNEFYPYCPLWFYDCKNCPRKKPHGYAFEHTKINVCLERLDRAPKTWTYVEK